MFRIKTRFEKLFCLFCILSLLSTLAGCWAEDEPEDASLSLMNPETGQIESEENPEEQVPLPANFALPYQPGQTLDPINCPDGMQQVIGSLLYESLFRLDTQLEPQPCLCAEYTYNPDSLTYYLTLRDGVTFTDGSALTSDDVAYSLKRAKNSERYGSRLSHMKTAYGDGNSVVITLNAANRALPALLDIPIVKSGTENNLIPMGTGPYYFSEESDGTALLKNYNWWQGTGQPLEKIILSKADSQEVMLYQFSSHEIQLITADLTGTTPVSFAGGVLSQDTDTTILQYLGFNTRREIFQEPALRKALNLGIDRTALVSAYMAGHGLPTQFPISPHASIYPADLEQESSYDAFVASLNAVNPDSQTVTLLVNEENTFKASAASYLASTLSANGLQLQVEVLPWEEYLAALNAGHFDLYYGEVKLTADWDLQPLLASYGELNYGGWSDEKTDMLLAACAAGEDRTAAYRELCIYLREQCPILPLCFKSTAVLSQEGVLEDLTPTMAEPFYNLTGCKFHLSSS